MTPYFRMFLVGLAVALLVLVPVLAIPKELSPQVEAACEKQSGCIWISRDWILERLTEARVQAFAEGRLEGVADTTERCRNFTGFGQ